MTSLVTIFVTTFGRVAIARGLLRRLNRTFGWNHVTVNPRLARVHKLDFFTLFYTLVEVRKDETCTHILHYTKKLRRVNILIFLCSVHRPRWYTQLCLHSQPELRHPGAKSWLILDPRTTGMKRQYEKQNTAPPLPTPPVNPYSISRWDMRTAIICNFDISIASCSVCVYFIFKLWLFLKKKRVYTHHPVQESHIYVKHYTPVLHVTDTAVFRQGLYCLTRW